MNNDLCVMACFDNNNLCGYLIASSIEYNRQFPLLATMIDCFDKIIYKGKSLNKYKSYISGPGCVDKKHRGHGIYLKLVQNVLDFLKQQSNPPDLRVLFVSTENSISINAQKKVGMEIVGQFEFNNKIFLILVMPLQPEFKCEMQNNNG